jgi:hypothetical protein
MGSFFIPLTVMVYMYARISCVVAHRHNQLTAPDSNDQVLCIALSANVEHNQQLTFLHSDSSQVTDEM